MVDVKTITSRFDAVIFDVGNTLVKQSSPGTPLSDLRAEALAGVLELITALRGKTKLGIVSNTTSMTSTQLEILLEPLGLTEGFGCIIATADRGIHKPDPSPLLQAAEQLGVHPSSCLYIGDVANDRIAAQAAGMSFCFAGPHLAYCVARWFGGTNELDRSKTSFRIPSTDRAQDCLDTLASLAKPPGSFGRLESTLSRIAAIQGTAIPCVDPAAAAIFVGDHGHAEDDHITPWPWSISRQIAGILGAGTAAGSVFAKSADAYLETIDVGIATGPTPANVVDNRIAHGTANIRSGPAMSLLEVEQALEIGAATAVRLIGGGTRALCIGEVGIGNTTVSSIISSWATGLDADAATGPGAGIPPDAVARKSVVVRSIVDELAMTKDPLVVLQRAGGFEVAAMAGCIIAAASLNVPVLLDGVTTLAAATIAELILPGVKHSCIATHVSPEPSTQALFDHLGLEPLFDLGMRVGEGTGAILSIPILRAGCLAMTDMTRLTELSND